MEETENTTETDVVVIGAGISGLVTGKCMREDGFKVIILERTGEVGGLWNYREKDYGVMRCTHINVSKYNYCFSDFPFHKEATDYPHHSEMAQYIVDYTKNFKLQEIIRFNTKVISLTQKADRWEVVTDTVEDDGQTLEGRPQTITCRFLAIASGHHAKPSSPSFSGEETFNGEIIHSVDYKDPLTNGFVGKRVLLVGIGNSAVDVAVDCATVGRCKSVYISTRSGAWILPNYVFGLPTDLYACRAFFLLPWKWGNFILETVIKFLYGNPKRWGLNPKMKALQTQPTVSPTLIHHIQRRNIKIVPNISKVDGDTVQFVNGETAQFDKIVYCTGYKIDLPYLSHDLRAKVLDEGSNAIAMYKNVFSPNLGSNLAFIGFVQPATGGVLTMSETQARWFSQVCLGNVRLPPKHEMEQAIRTEKMTQSDKWYQSARHTIQKDPIVYNDEIASFFGAKPELLKHPSLAWRLMLSSCGASQYRLQGPGRWSGAAAEVRRVPLTDMMNFSGYLGAAVIAILLFYVLRIVFHIGSFIF
ncbi:flavin-containing monooxygenase 5-like [Littorina saxatilis]|uniref:Flavin-containing monooxygenase n=1 Tax=Littorina saxatilis TaxID=31220 RepID=A0AAN9AP17_9CAEN